ncbi:MAG: sensor histidine kinase [Rudaea sp.]
MPRPAASELQADEPRWLPDFCSLPVLFAVMVVAELLVLVILIAPSDETRALLPRLATTSVFVQWLGLVCAVCLCKLRPQLRHLSPGIGVLTAYILMLLITVLGSAIVFEIDHQLNLGLTLPEQFKQRFVWRSAALCALLGAALLRYFYVIEQWRARVRAESKARFEALQARIRPHFLFNSMNTIASLISARPKDAERAVENLSDLFRAALGNDKALSTLAAEIDLTLRYLAIEKLRFGDRLRIETELRDVPQSMPMPVLLLQPLVENAVYHGIAALPEGGTIAIGARRSGGVVEIEIRNPCPPPGARVAQRHGMALANTRSRIAFHFGARGTLDIDAGEHYFACTLRLPDESADR